MAGDESSEMNCGSEFTGSNKPVVTVILPGPLLRLFPEANSHVNVSAATVDEMLDELNSKWPGLRDRIADSSPSIRRHMCVFVDGMRATLDTELPHGTDVYVMTAMSGG